MQISYRFGFDAAHHFPGYPAGHPYHGVHGHSFQAEVAIRGTPDPATGFIADLGQVERACLEARAHLERLSGEPEPQQRDRHAAHVGRVEHADQLHREPPAQAAFSAPACQARWSAMNVEMK